MKSVLVVSSVIALSVLLFFLVGVLSPGQKIESTVKVYAPLVHSWGIYHDRQLLNEWMPGVKSVNLINGQPRSVGAQYELLMTDQHGEESKMLEEVTAFDSLELFAMNYENDILSGTMQVYFEGLGDTVTVINSINHYKGKSTVLRSLFHFFNWKIEEEADKQLEALKELIEKKNERSN